MVDAADVMGSGRIGVGGRKMTQIVLKGSSRPWPWTSPSRRSNG